MFAACKTYALHSRPTMCPLHFPTQYIFYRTQAGLISGLRGGADPTGASTAIDVRIGRQTDVSWTYSTIITPYSLGLRLVSYVRTGLCVIDHRTCVVFVQF
jgi:hypothetical protein